MAPEETPTGEALTGTVAPATADLTVNHDEVVAIGAAASEDGATYTCTGCNEPVAAAEAVKSADGVYHPEHHPTARNTVCPSCGHRFSA